MERGDLSDEEKSSSHLIEPSGSTSFSHLEEVGDWIAILSAYYEKKSDNISDEMYLMDAEIGKIIL